MTTTTTATAVPQRPTKPPPPGPAPPAPASASGGPATTNGRAQVNGTTAQTPKGKKTAARSDASLPVDPHVMYESLKTKIAALEEELNHADEEELKFAEEAQKSVRGLEDSAVQAKYIELFAELKRIEREHAKEKQRLSKDKDTAKSQLNKANQTKAKLENLARELTKDNKKLREENQQLLQDVAKGLEEIRKLNLEITKGKEKALELEIKIRELPDIVVKVVCKYRAELFFKISRKTKLSRLFEAWSARMENGGASLVSKPGAVNGLPNGTPVSASKAADATSIHSVNGTESLSPPPLSFMYMHQGRRLEADKTIEEAGIDEADEILAVELMDLTGPVPEDSEELVTTEYPKIKKNWTDSPEEAKKAMEDIFDSVTKERLRLILRQYELRERHFECLLRSKELELLLAKYRESEQRQLVEFERNRIDKLEEDNQHVRKELEDVQNGQTLLIEKLIQCCKEPNAERTQRLFTSLREELEKRGTKLVDEPGG